LPDGVVNKIAAGEVVERPASVVKELVENAIDAGASEISIEVRKGGRALVRVRDNGCGMAKGDALLALDRHTTSKITDASDLFTIRTRGFRGEALPSIAAVSRLDLTTKERGGLAGSRVIVEGGVVDKVKETGAPDGTEVVVRDIFFNTPARRKFLRSERAENSHIASVVVSQALTRPEIGFTLVAEGEEVIKAPAAAKALDRIVAIFGADLADKLIPFEEERGRVSARGFVGTTEVTRGNRTGQHFFVNGRPVQDKIMSFAVADACSGIFPAKRYPVVFLFLEIEPSEVDVNVHPAKREVRFRNGSAVRDLIRDALSRALRSSGPIAEAWPAAQDGAVGERAARYESRGEGGLISRIPAAPHRQEPLPWEEESPAVSESGTEALRPIGQIKNLYVICETPEGMAIIDQHAAHERILFERVMRFTEKGEGDVQRLLIPAVVHLSAPEYALASEYLGTLTALGIGVELFGNTDVKVDHLPVCLGEIDAERLMRDVLGELAEEERSRAVKEEIAARVAMKVCRAAVKRSDPLGIEQMKRLAGDLLKCETPYTCPHGRPTIIRMSQEELDRKFGRT
jgi:DNA mismatch repair protein MutL